MGTTTSGVLGLGHDAVLNTARLVLAGDVGNGGMVESLGRVTQGLTSTRVPRGRVVIHDVRAKNLEVMAQSCITDRKCDEATSRSN